MFDNIHKSRSHIKNQQSNIGVVDRKKAGRPSKPNMEVLQIRLDKSLHAELKIFCKNTGINKSSFIATSIRNAMDKSKKLYKMIEV